MMHWVFHYLSVAAGGFIVSGKKQCVIILLWVLSIMYEVTGHANLYKEVLHTEELSKNL